MISNNKELINEPKVSVKDAAKAFRDACKKDSRTFKVPYGFFRQHNSKPQSKEYTSEIDER